MKGKEDYTHHGLVVCKESCVSESLTDRTLPQFSLLVYMRVRTAWCPEHPPVNQFSELFCPTFYEIHLKRNSYPFKGVAILKLVK